MMSNDGVFGCRVADNSVESVMCVGAVLDVADGAVSFDQRVLALYYVTVAALVLGLVVTGVTVGYRVREVVFGVRVHVILTGHNAVYGRSVMGYRGGVVCNGSGGVVSYRSDSDGGMGLVMTLDRLRRHGCG